LTPAVSNTHTAGMTLADKLTASRLFLAPLFFAAFRWGGFMGPVPYVALLVLLFAVIEISDLLDGFAARRDGTVSDFGKLFDPYADVFARLTYFVCFALIGVMPAWALVLILYRELSINFIRMLLAQRGVAMGARPGGKLKSAVYMVAGAASLVYLSLQKLGLIPGFLHSFAIGIYAVYALAAALALISFADYFLQYRKLARGS
jgi:CDP-diacylglycerol---glycerol-3-phosphate 3-phosphatidyltransferase